MAVEEGESFLAASPLWSERRSEFLAEEEGTDTLDVALDEAARHTLEGLFNSLITHEAAQVKTELERRADYREYFDYDLKIHNADGSHSLYDRVFQDRSGGETQTPFYVDTSLDRGPDGGFCTFGVGFALPDGGFSFPGGGFTFPDGGFSFPGGGAAGD